MDFHSYFMLRISWYTVGVMLSTAHFLIVNPLAFARVKSYPHICWCMATFPWTYIQSFKISYYVVSPDKRFAFTCKRFFIALFFLAFFYTHNTAINHVTEHEQRHLEIMSRPLSGANKVTRLAKEHPIYHKVVTTLIDIYTFGEFTKYY